MSLDATTQKIKDDILALYPALVQKYKDTEASLSSEAGGVPAIRWRRRELWVGRVGPTPDDCFANWQGPREVLLVAQRLPDLLDALDEAVEREAAQAAKDKADRVQAQVCVNAAAERLGVYRPYSPHPPGYEPDAL